MGFGGFVFFQCMATKYITYTYPLLFPASLLLGHYIEEHRESCFNKKYLLFVGSGFVILVSAAFWVVTKQLVMAEMIFLLPLALIIGIMIDYLFRLQTNERIYSIASIAVVFYIALIFSIAVPLSEERSAKNLGQLLTAENVHEAGLYGKYPTSAVFYSDSKIVKLMHEREVAGCVPKDFSWTTKNVMPFATLEQNPYRVVVVTPYFYKSFISQQSFSWQVIASDNSWIMLRRI